MLWFSVALLAGLVVAKTSNVIPESVAAAGLLLLCTRIRWLVLVGVVMIGLFFGYTKGADRARELEKYWPLYNQKSTFVVHANEDAVYSKYGQLTFVGVRVQNADSGIPLTGQIGISGFGPLAIYENDELLVTGKLREGVGSYQGFMSYAEIETVSHNPSLISDIRRRFGTAITSVFPEPVASFAMGILLGQRASLPNEVKDNLQMVGLTHIIAVSGANLTIILDAMRRVLGKRSKRLTIAITIGLMLMFVAMTGGSASIVRAGFVSGLTLWAAYYGRRTKPLLIITMAAAITAMINPIYIWSDASWYLSFLAFFGVLIVLPRVQLRLPSMFESNLLLAIALESLCAEIMSLPYVLYTFGQMSFVGLLANVLVVSFIPIAMLLAFIGGLAGLFLWPIAGWFAWPGNIVMTYMLDTAQVLAGRPGVFNDNIWLNGPSVVFIYVLIALLLMAMSFKDKSKSAIVTDKKQPELYRILGRTG